jgi:hypothetical protein
MGVLPVRQPKNRRHRADGQTVLPMVFRGMNSRRNTTIAIINSAASSLAPLKWLRNEDQIIWVVLQGHLISNVGVILPSFLRICDSSCGETGYFIIVPLFPFMNDNECIITGHKVSIGYSASYYPASKICDDLRFNSELQRFAC